MLAARPIDDALRFFLFIHLRHSTIPVYTMSHIASCSMERQPTSSASFHRSMSSAHSAVRSFHNFFCSGNGVETVRLVGAAALDVAIGSRWEWLLSQTRGFDRLLVSVALILRWLKPSQSKIRSSVGIR